MDKDDIWCLFDTLRIEDHDKDDSKNSADEDVCEFCGAASVILEEGNYICKTCHTLTNRFIDSNAEWRYYGAEDSKSTDPTRCGMPVNELLPDSSLGSVISNKMNESYDMRKIRKYHMWNSMSYKDRALFQIFENITINASQSGITPSIIEEAKTLYKTAAETKITRGDNKSGLIASSIYMSCKINKVPRSTKEIAKMFKIKVTTMSKGCKKFLDVVKLDLDSTSPKDFIQRFASKLNLSLEIRDLSKYIVQKADELNIASENTPPSVAAGAIYLCIILCNLGISKKDLSVACGISPVTITKCYKKLYDYRGKLLPKEAILKYHVK